MHTSPTNIAVDDRDLPSISDATESNDQPAPDAPVAASTKPRAESESALEIDAFSESVASQFYKTVAEYGSVPIACGKHHLEEASVQAWRDPGTKDKPNPNYHPRFRRRLNEALAAFHEERMANLRRAAANVPAPEEEGPTAPGEKRAAAKPVRGDWKVDVWLLQNLFPTCYSSKAVAALFPEPDEKDSSAPMTEKQAIAAAIRSFRKEPNVHQ